MYLVILDPYGQDDGSGDVSVLLQNPEQGLEQVQARQEKIKSKKKHTFCPQSGDGRPSLAESPECWNLEFQPVQIFADNFLIFADKIIYLQENVL